MTAEPGPAAAAAPGPEHRILVAAPTGQDAGVIERVLAPAGARCHVCADTAALCREIREGALVAVAAEEMLVHGGIAALAEVFADQPEWSDLPLVFLAAAGSDLHASWRSLTRIGALGHTVVLQRPVPRLTLLSVVQAAMASRLRQYQMRDELVRRRRIERRLREEQQRKDDFLAALGHELRNPLAAVQMGLELIEAAGCEQERTAQTLPRIRRELEVFGRLLDDLLDVARITRGKLSLQLERVDVAAVARASLRHFSGAAEDRGQQLIASLPPDPVYLRVDEVRLGQVLDNLLDNAIKYSGTGDRIELDLRADAGGVRITVADQGLGIPSDRLESVFEPFEQLDVLEAPHYSGLGLGLSLSRALVQRHGGTIAAHSAGRGRGSEFRILLPWPGTAGPPPGTPPAMQGEGVRAAAAGPEAAADAAPARRVLVVEDNPETARFACELLAALGHVAQSVRGGLEAVEVARRFRPELVLLDVGLPDISGYEVARRLRADPCCCDAMLVAVTGLGLPVDRERSDAAGIDRHFTKPLRIGALRSVLRALGTGGGPRGDGAGGD